MHQFHEEKTLNFSPQDLFNIVLDIESYPLFLPWCEAARIISASDNEIIAELVIQFKGFTEKYQSRIVSNAQSQLYIIEVIAISGPFKYLSNSWQFKEIAQRESLCSFKVEFELKSLLLDKVLGLFFANAVAKMIRAFEKRAEELSGKTS